MIAYSYLRVSSAEQAKDSRDGVSRQKRLAEDFCKAEGIELSHHTFKDLGVSAFKGHNKDPRSALSAFITGIDLGKIQTPAFLLIEHLDRLSREDVISALNLLQTICRKGVTIVTLNDGRRYTAESIKRDLNDILICVISFALAYEESLKKQKRLREAWASAREKAVTGKKIKTSHPSWLKLENNEFLVIEERANQIRFMFQMFIEKGFGYKSISNYMNKQGWKTVNGLTWYPQVVKNILKNPAVIGEFHPCIRKEGKREKTGAIIKGYYPAIVSEQDFYTVRSRLSIHPSRVGKPQQGAANIWEGLLKCGYCGGTMGLFHSTTLICWNAFNSQTCVRHAWRVDEYEHPLLLELVDVLKERNVELNQPLKREIEGLVAKVADLSARIETLIEMASKLRDTTDVLRKIDSLTEERSSVERQVKEKQSLLDELTGGAVSSSIDLTGVLTNFDGVERLQLQRLMKKHIERIRVFPAGEPEINEEFRRQRDQLVEAGNGVHSVNKTLVQRLGIKSRRYMEISTRNPIDRDGRKVTCFKVKPERTLLTAEQLRSQKVVIE